MSVTIEDLQRKRLSAVAEAKAIRDYLETEELTQSELARRLGYSQSALANKPRLLKLPESVQEAVDEGRLSERHARALLKVAEAEQEKVASVILERNYTVRESEEYIASLASRHTLHDRGVSNSVRIGINTMKQAYELCRKSGLDASLQETEYENEIKLVIRFRK